MVVVSMVMRADMVIHEAVCSKSQEVSLKTDALQCGMGDPRHTPCLSVDGN